MRRAFAPDTQLNWLARYVPVLPYLDLAACRSLLEVGPGARGAGCVVATPFVGLEVRFATPPRPPMRGLEYDGGRLPCRPEAFHTVLSLDTLEHVPPAARAEFLRELTRVAAERVVVGFPADAAGADVDGYLAALHARLGLDAPDWLHEHGEHGLPVAADVEALLEGCAGWRWEAVPTTGTLPCLLLTLGDVLPDVRRWLRPVLAAEGVALARWIEAASFGPSFRRVYLLERESPRAPLVDLARPATLADGLACPRCMGPCAPAGTDGVACAACNLRIAPDARGVLALRDRAPAGRAAAPAIGVVAPTGRTTAPSVASTPVTFVLRPDWLGSTDWVASVHNYLHAFAPDEDCVLWLRVEPSALDAEEALALLQPVLEPFGTEPFARVTLSDDPAEAPPAGAIELPAATPWAPEEFRARRDQAARPA